MEIPYYRRKLHNWADKDRECFTQYIGSRVTKHYKTSLALKPGFHYPS